ncbi:MAG: hypothetical protein R3A10_14420 [Caldilineaceae bacterium]
MTGILRVRIRHLPVSGGAGRDRILHQRKLGALRLRHHAGAIMLAEGNHPVRLRTVVDPADPGAPVWLCVRPTAA